MIGHISESAERSDPCHGCEKEPCVNRRLSILHESPRHATGFDPSSHLWLHEGFHGISAHAKYEGWKVNHKRVERIWRREGLKVPKKQPKRGRLWLNDGSCIRLRPEHKNHVWSYDFVTSRTHDGRAFRMLNILDE